MLDVGNAQGRPEDGWSRSSLSAQSTTPTVHNDHKHAKSSPHGQANTFEELWEQYRGELYRCCLRWMGGDPHQADEALSSVALKVLHELPRHAHKITNAKCWLLRLTYNLCMDMHRGHSRAATNVASRAASAELHDDAIARAIDQPEQLLLRQELGGQLQRAIAHLPVRLREPFVLRVVEELPCREIAQQLALTPENVRKRVQHARARVRTELYAYLSSGNDRLEFTH